MKLAETQPRANRAPDVRFCCKFCCTSEAQVNPILSQFYVRSNCCRIQTKGKGCKSTNSQPLLRPIVSATLHNNLLVALFKRSFNKSRWDRGRQKVGLANFKFDDLRKTFGSVRAQNGISTVVIQKLLEHSSPDLTNKVYINVDPVLRQAIDTMPAGDWLRVRIVGKKENTLMQLSLPQREQLSQTTIPLLNS